MAIYEHRRCIARSVMSKFCESFSQLELATSDWTVAYIRQLRKCCDASVAVISPVHSFCSSTAYDDLVELLKNNPDRNGAMWNMPCPEIKRSFGDCELDSSEEDMSDSQLLGISLMNVDEPLDTDAVQVSSIVSMEEHPDLLSIIGIILVLMFTITNSS